MHDMFQMGDRYADFDRWANSVAAARPMPTTRDEFLRAVREMISQVKS